jgi:hypothetical protein
LLYPDGTNEEGSIPGLISKLKYMHLDSELHAWLSSALEFKRNESHANRRKVTDHFEIEGIEYKVILDPRSGEIELHFPARIYVCKRSTMINDFPELSGICKCMLSSTIISILSEENPECLDPINQCIEKLSFPKGTEYDMNGAKVWIAYNQTEDVFLIHLDSYKVLGHVLTIPSDLWEYEALHNGLFQDHLERLITAEYIGKEEVRPK